METSQSMIKILLIFGFNHSMKHPKLTKGNNKVILTISCSTTEMKCQCHDQIGSDLAEYFEFYLLLLS